MCHTLCTQSFWWYCVTWVLNIEHRFKCQVPPSCTRPWGRFGSPAESKWHSGTFGGFRDQPTKCQKENLFSYSTSAGVQVLSFSQMITSKWHSQSQEIASPFPNLVPYNYLPQYTCPLGSVGVLYRSESWGCQISHGHCEVTSAQHSGRQFTKHNSPFSATS